MFVAVIACLIFCSCYVFWENLKVKYALFDIYAGLVLLSSVTMIVALWKMKITISHYRRVKVNWKLMINHACAFVLFIFGYIASEIIDHYTHDYYYELWLMIAIFGTISMFCLAVLLWHLGTKDAEDAAPLLEVLDEKETTALEESGRIWRTEEDENEDLHASERSSKLLNEVLNERIWRQLMIEEVGRSIDRNRSNYSKRSKCTSSTLSVSDDGNESDE